MTDKPFIRFLRSQGAPLAVALFIGFSIGLLFAALFFPARVEVVEVQAPPVVEPPIDKTAPPELPDVIYTPAAMETLPGWSEDTIADAYPSLTNACGAFENRDPTQPAGPRAWNATVSDWLGPCMALKSVPPDDEEALRTFFKTHYTAYAVTTPASTTGTFTGYYETALRGSLTRTETFSVPLFALPRDLIETGSPRI